MQSIAFTYRRAVPYLMAILFVLCSAIGAQGQQVQYKLIDLDAYLPNDGHIGSFANGVNLLGQVVGGSNYSNSTQHPILWNWDSNLAAKDLSATFGSDANLGRINNHAIADGTAGNSTGSPTAIAWDNNNGVQINLTGLDTYSSARGVNDLNQIVGYTTPDDTLQTEQAYLWDIINGSRKLGAPSGWEDTIATVINGFSRVAGIGNTPTYVQSWIWGQDAGFTVIGAPSNNPNGLINAVVTDMNDSGKAVAYCYDNTGGPYHVFLYDPAVTPPWQDITAPWMGSFIDPNVNI